MPKSIILGRLNEPREMTASEAAYWAAMVDGEGSIMVTTATMKEQRRPQYRLLLSIANTDFGLLETLARMVGVGTLQKSRRDHEAWKDKGQLILNHEAADYAIRQLRPYLVAKVAQADLAMRFMELKRAWSKANDNHAEQAAIRDQMRLLNGRGHAHQKAYAFAAVPTQARSCEYEGCNQPHYGNGFCRQHYRWIYHSKTWTGGAGRSCQNCDEPLAVNARVDTKFCSTACKMKFHRRQGCYAPEAQVGGRQCGVEGCERPHHAGGSCRRHYMQAWHASRAT